MLYGNQSISHYTKPNVAIWMSMAFQAGVLNMGGFMACHRFVSHVTGFATFFGYELSSTGRGPRHAWGMLVVPLFFLLGAMLSGQLVDIRIKLRKRPRYYVSFGIIFLLLLTVFLGGILGYFGEFGAPLVPGPNYILLILLCLACGVQNGTITSVSKSVVRTTHLTGITTDLGIGLARLVNSKKLRGLLPDEGKATAMRLGIILFFGLGSVFGGWAFSRFGYRAFFAPVFSSGILFALMVYFQIRKRFS